MSFKHRKFFTREDIRQINEVVLMILIDRLYQKIYGKGEKNENL